MFHALILFVFGIIRKMFRILLAFYTALNRWMAFLAHLTMLFFIWNSLLCVMGMVTTIQMIIGFGFEALKVTSPKSANALSNPSQANSSTASNSSPKPRSAITEYWQSRRKAYQEVIDGLYVKYMNRLIGVQQQQQQFFQNQQYFQNSGQYYPGGYYDDGWYGRVNVGTPEALVDDDLTVPTKAELEAMTGTSGTTGQFAIEDISDARLQETDEEIMVG
jgi:hypothetical protein